MACRRTMLLGANAVLLLGCGGGTTAPPPPSPGLVVDPLQYRDDIAIDRLQLHLTNGSGEQLALTSMQLRWSALSSELVSRRLLVGPGQEVDLPVPLGTARCSIDGTAVAAAPSLDAARVVFTLDDGSNRTAEIVDHDDTLAAILADACQRQMIGRQVTIGFADVQRTELDGRPITVARLQVDRGAALGGVRVLSAGGTIPFTLQFPDVPTGAAALIELPEGTASAGTAVRFTEGRCDAHAVAEAKQPFRFVLQLDLGDGTARSYVVEPDPTLHRDMLATAADGCAAMGETGSLDP